MRSARLLAILLLLQARGQVTARELSRVFEVTVRTILRDLTELHELGLPVTSMSGPRGGIKLAPGVQLDPRQFIGLDRAQAPRSTSSTPPGSADLDDIDQTAQIELLRVALLKLEAALPPEYQRDLERARSQLLLATPPAEISGHLRHLATIRAALWRSLRLHIHYRAADGSASGWHLLDPCVLLLRNGHWYLMGYDYEREDMRAFAVKDIEAARLVDEAVVWPVALDVQFTRGTMPGREGPAARPLRVQLLLENEGVSAVRSEGFLSGEPKPSGGSLWLVTLEFPQTTQAVHYVLRLGAWARVLSPAEVRAHVVRHVHELSRIYGVTTGE